MRTPTPRALPLAIVALLTSCGDDGAAPDAGADAGAPVDAGRPDAGPEAPPEGCHPFAPPGDCLLPFPSDHFLVDDPALPSGRRVVLPEAAWLQTRAGPADFHGLHVADGWSPGTPILALFPEGVDEGALVFHTDDVSATARGEGPTVLIDAETGAPVLHFAEVDPQAEDGRRALILRPMVRLTDGRRYVVALRDLTDPSGAPLPSPAAFAAVRDGAPEPEHSELAARFERDVFPVLEAAGVDRSSLVLAWDFTVRTRDNVTGDMLAMRADLLARLDEAPPEVRVVEVRDDVDDFVLRRVEVTVRVPLYVDSPEVGATLVRDAEGRVVARGEAEVPLTVLIPRSLAAPAPPGRALQYGHGFFGSREEAATNVIPQLADERGFVVFAADWWGMSGADRLHIADDLVNDFERTMTFTDRAHQGMANLIAVARAIRQTLPDLPELQVDGRLPYDPAEVYFDGNSQGHILGGTYLALSPDVSRGALGVGGANFSLIMFRARPFAIFLTILTPRVRDGLERQKIALFTQMSFDRIDPLTYAPFVFDEPLPGAPPERHVLMQLGLADAEVPNLAGHLHARALGLGLLTPATREVAGLEPVDAPATGRGALVEIDFGVEPTDEARFAPMNDVHEGVRREPAAQEQLDRFLRPGGVIEHTCDGACDPG